MNRILKNCGVNFERRVAGAATFAVQGKEIETLHIFIFDNFDDWIQMEQEGMNSSVADKAIIAREIHVEWLVTEIFVKKLDLV